MSLPANPPPGNQFLLSKNFPLSTFSCVFKFNYKFKSKESILITPKEGEGLGRVSHWLVFLVHKYIRLRSTKEWDGRGGGGTMVSFIFQG